MRTSTVHAIHELIHRGLDQAVVWKIVTENVSDNASLPRVPKQERPTLTKEQAQKLLDTAKGHPLETLLTVALATGMRRGEMLGLRWQDINFETMSLQVRRTVGFGKNHKYVENEPKTSSGRRRIVLPQFVIDALKQHRLQQIERRLQVGEAWIDRDLVFCKDNGDFLALTTLHMRFKALLKEAGLPNTRFHDLRHSAATILLSMSVDMKVIQEILGHSSYLMTANIYSHVLPSMQKEAMDKMDDMFRRQT